VLAAKELTNSTLVVVLVLKLLVYLYKSCDSEEVDRIFLFVIVLVGVQFNTLVLDALF